MDGLDRAEWISVKVCCSRSKPGKGQGQLHVGIRLWDNKVAGKDVDIMCRLPWEEIISTYIVKVNLLLSGHQKLTYCRFTRFHLTGTITIKWPVWELGCFSCCHHGSSEEVWTEYTALQGEFLFLDTGLRGHSAGCIRVCLLLSFRCCCCCLSVYLLN